MSCPACGCTNAPEKPKRDAREEAIKAFLDPNNSYRLMHFFYNQSIEGWSGKYLSGVSGPTWLIKLLHKSRPTIFYKPLFLIIYYCFQIKE